MEQAIKRIRLDFPLLSRKIDGNKITYLDSAATSLKPDCVINAICNYYKNNSSNIHRGKHYLSEEASNVYEECRYKIAEFIGCFSDEIVFTKNTTEALNLLAHGLCLNEKDDKVVITLNSHHSNYVPWLRLGNVQIVKLDKNNLIDLNHYKDLIKQKPKVVALTHCSNVTGIYSPVKELVEMAQEVGAVTILDVAQSIPHRRINVKELGVDFLAFSAHKMLGPSGIGVLYGKSNRLIDLKPFVLGGGSVDWVEDLQYISRNPPYRFEAGTPNIAGVYGLLAAINYINQIGYEFIAKHDQQIKNVLLQECRKNKYIKLFNDDDNIDRSAIVSFAVKGCENLANISRSLSDSYGIMCRSGHLCSQPLVDWLTDGEVMRVSCYIYNNEREIVDFFTALNEICEIYGFNN